MYFQEKTIEYLAVICVVSLLLSTFLLYRKTKECQVLEQKNSIQMANSTTLHKVLSRNMKATMYFDCTQLNDDIFLYKYSNGKTDSIPIGNIKNQNVLFVPKQCCNVCYDEVYDALLYAKDSLNIEIIAITEKEKYNEVRNIIHDLGFKLNVYYINSFSFWKSTSIEYAPFFSYIDKYLRCNHCFIPLVNYPEYSYLYLRNISKKYWNKPIY